MYFLTVGGRERWFVNCAEKCIANRDSCRGAYCPCLTENALFFDGMVMQRWNVCAICYYLSRSS